MAEPAGACSRAPWPWTGCCWLDLHIGSVERISLPVALPFGGMRLVMRPSLKPGVCRSTLPRANPGAPVKKPVASMTLSCSIQVWERTDAARARRVRIVVYMVLLEVRMQMSGVVYSIDLRDWYVVERSCCEVAKSVV